MKAVTGVRAALLPLLATLVTVAVAFAAFFVAGALGLAGITMPLAAGACVGILVSLLLGHRTAATTRSLEEILSAADKDVIDLAALLPDNGFDRASHGTGAGKDGVKAGAKRGGKSANRNGAVGVFLSIAEKLNINLVDISRAALKFGLFSQDISFSSAHLAELSQEQVEAMDRIRTLADQYGKALAALVDDFTGLSNGLKESTLSYSELAERSRKSSEILAVLQQDAAAAAASATEGKTSIDQAERASEDVGKALALIATALERADERTRTAGKALSLVEDLAERTRLLATNASIEAAHAGSAGRGFAVIAGEIRNLAESASSSTTQVSSFLKLTMVDIAEANKVAAGSVKMAEVLARTGKASRASFTEVETGADHIEEFLRDFGLTFAAQSEATEAALASWRRAIDSVADLGIAVGGQEKGYGAISDEVKRAAEGSLSASRSARILSQLGTYLRAGGYDMEFALHAFKVDEEKASRRHLRREHREILVYNLEALDTQGKLVGFLGDLSASGMLLYAEKPFLIGETVQLRLRLPISAEGDRSVPVTCIPRRIEEDGRIRRVGCSLAGDAATKASVQELIGRLGLSSLKAATVPPPAQVLAAAQVPAVGRPPATGQAQAGGQTPDDDLEELEEMEEIGELEDV
ncbi:MAG: methyl-accepting chemotaxis protein [Spirochaetota bacterium]